MANNEKEQVLAPYTGDDHQQVEDAEVAPIDEPNPPNRIKRNKCLLYIALFIILQTAILLIFVLVIMRVRTPKLSIHSSMLQNAQPVSQANPSFRATLAFKLSIKNTNFGRYKYQNTMVMFYFQGTSVGEAVVNKSSVGWKSTEEIEVAVDLDMTRTNMTDGELERPLDSGIMKIMIQARMKGRVEMMFVFKKNRSTNMDCTMNIDSASQKLRIVVCK